MLLVLLATTALAAQVSTPPASSTPEVIAEIRIHGNASIADDEIVRVAGIRVGEPLEEVTMTQVEERLRKSGRFDSIEVRKRFRSLDDFSQVALLLVVHERPGSSRSGIMRPIQKIRSRVMFLPIQNYDDG